MSSLLNGNFTISYSDNLPRKLLNRLNALLIVNFFDYIHAAKMLIWADNG